MVDLTIYHLNSSVKFSGVHSIYYRIRQLYYLFILFETLPNTFNCSVGILPQKIKNKNLVVAVSAMAGYVYVRCVIIIYVFRCM
jgi:hypothetical protein